MTRVAPHVAPQGALPAIGGVLLAIDGAPSVGSVALVRDGVLLVARAVAMRPPAKPTMPDAGARRGDDDPLMELVAATLREAAVDPRTLDGVACGAGPGGFTSLRIAAALAKGIAHAAGCPLLAAPSLAWAAAVRAPRPGVWLATLDALRGERYVACVTVGDGAHLPAPNVAPYDYLGVHPAASVDDLVASSGALGRIDIDGDERAAPIAAGVVDFPPDAVDLAGWEPTYGRLAEAQVRWEAAHGPLSIATGAPGS